MELKNYKQPNNYPNFCIQIESIQKMNKIKHQFICILGLNICAYIFLQILLLSLIINIMKGRNIPQIIDLQSSHSENSEKEPAHPQIQNKQSHNKLIPANSNASKFNYSGFSLEANNNSLKVKKKQPKKEKSSQNYVAKSNISANVYEPKNQHQQTIKSMREELEIYQFLRGNKIITGNTTINTHKCNICNANIDDDGINYCFQCEKCEKYCHFQCMVDTSVCPRCFYNWKISKYKLPNQQNLINTKNKQEITKRLPHQTNSDQNSNSNSNQDNIYKEKQEQNILQLTPLPEYYNTQIRSFMKKYPFYLDKNNNIKLPISDHIIYQTGFIQYLLQNRSNNKKFVIRQLPKEKKLPHYYGLLIEIWNFYTNFKCMIGDKQICKYSLQIFSEQLRNNQIYTFVLPVIDIVLNNSPNTKVASILKLFQDLKSQNLFEFFGRYFWAFVILQIINNSKNKQDQFFTKFNEKLNLMLDKRMHIVTDFQQKVQILKFVIDMAQKLTCFRNWVTDSIKDQGQLNSKITQIIAKQRQMLKNHQKSTTIRLSNVQEKTWKLKNHGEQHPPKDYLNEMKKLQTEKQQILKKQEQLRAEVKELREEVKSVEFANQLQASNKVFHLGKDRNKYSYWYVFRAEANAIFMSSSIPQQISRQNGSGQIQKWGIYEGEQLEQLFSSLNCAGIEQKRLKQNIQKLLMYNLVTTTPSKKLARVKSLYNKIIAEIKQQSQQEDEQIMDCREFLNNNIGQINLTQIRKLLLESLKIFNNYIKKIVGIWGANQEYNEKIRSQKFKTLEDIKKFVLEFGRTLYSLKEQYNKKNKKGRQKRASQLWANRLQIFTIWKSKLQSSTKNIEVFIFTFILYLQVMNTARKISHPEKFKKKSSYKKSKSKSSSSWSRSQQHSKSQQRSGSYQS